MPDDTLRAKRFPGLADPAAMFYQQKIKIEPVGAGHYFHQVALDLIRVSLCAQAKTLRKSSHVGIDGNALGFSEGRGQNDVGRLAGHARQLDQLVHGIRHPAAILRYQLIGQADETPGFVPEKPVERMSFSSSSCRPGPKIQRSDISEKGQG